MTSHRQSCLPRVTFIQCIDPVPCAVQQPQQHQPEQQLLFIHSCHWMRQGCGCGRMLLVNGNTAAWQRQALHKLGQPVARVHSTCGRTIVSHNRAQFCHTHTYTHTHVQQWMHNMGLCAASASLYEHLGYTRSTLQQLLLALKFECHSKLCYSMNCSRIVYVLPVYLFIYKFYTNMGHLGLWICSELAL